MAPAPAGRPWRSLLVLLVLLIGLAAWAFWPGGEKVPRLGLDLRGGTQVILTPKPVSEGAQITDVQLQQTVEIIRQRVNGVGVAEAEVTVQGSGNNAAIVVSVPGVTSDRLVQLVGRTALLNFRAVQGLYGPAPFDPTPVPEPTPTIDPAPSPTATPTASRSEAPSTDASATKSASASAVIADSASPSPTSSPTPSPTPTPTPTPTPAPGPRDPIQATENTPAFQEEIAALDCLDPANTGGGIPDDPNLWLGTCQQDGIGKFNLQPAFIRGTQVASAQAQLPQGAVGGWVVSLTFDADGARALTEVSQELSALPDCGTGVEPCNAFAIVLDGVVVSAPRFNEPILGGQAQIEGNFTAEEAQDLANVLNYGALPVTLTIAEVTSVSPTIGDDQLRAGIIAGLLGLALVGLYLLFYYRALGVVAIFSLAVGAAMTYFVFVAFGNSSGLALTLSGVAGAIVAIGITADSFIVYFERIRDEIRDGKSLRQATDAGWARARRTLLAADFVSLLAAIVLYILSVGNVRGFAFALGLTTIIDVIVAFLFTRPLVVLIGRTAWMQRGSRWTGLDPRRLGGRSLTAIPKKKVSATAAGAEGGES